MKLWRIQLNRNGLFILSPTDERYAVQLPFELVHYTLAQKIDFASQCCDNLNLSYGYTYNAQSPIT